jgi:hypothetical protein
MANRGNLNAQKAGKHSFLALGSLPKGASYVRRCMGSLRKVFEQAVLAKRGEISPVEAALINSAVRHEGAAMLLTRWLRKGADTMTDSDRLAYLRDIGRETDRRDKCLKSLRLDGADSNIIAALYSGPVIDAENDDHDSAASPETPTTAKGTAA